MKLSTSQQRVIWCCGEWSQLERIPGETGWMIKSGPYCLPIFSHHTIDELLKQKLMLQNEGVVRLTEAGYREAAEMARACKDTHRASIWSVYGQAKVETFILKHRVDHNDLCVCCGTNVRKEGAWYKNCPTPTAPWWNRVQGGFNLGSLSFVRDCRQCGAPAKFGVCMRRGCAKSFAPLRK